MNLRWKILHRHGEYKHGESRLEFRLLSLSHTYITPDKKFRWRTDCYLYKSKYISWKTLHAVFLFKFNVLIFLCNTFPSFSGSRSELRPLYRLWVPNFLWSSKNIPNFSFMSFVVSRDAWKLWPPSPNFTYNLAPRISLILLYESYIPIYTHRYGYRNEHKYC